MANRIELRRLLAVFAGMLCLAAAAQQTKREIPSTVPAQKQTDERQPLKPDLPGLQRAHRLILKDGSFQQVREYQILGERVRYFSQERADWEELPADLVDWAATRKWENAHNSAVDASEDLSPAMKEARDLDKAAEEARNDQNGRTPQVTPGLDLPDEDGVFVLDTYQGGPELVELPASELNLAARNKKGLGTLNPLAGQTESLEIEGAHARIHLHVNDPVLYISLATDNGNATAASGAMTINTGGSKAVNFKHGAHSEKSGFAFVRVSQRNAVRMVGAVHVARDGTVTQDEDVIAAKVEVLPGKHWLKIHPEQPLAIGEYALVEILSASDISQTVWDFRVDPTKGSNPGSLTPILKPKDSR